MTPTKTQAERRHAKRRALERFGVALNRRQLAVMAAEIQAGRCELHYRQSLRVRVYRVKLGEQDALAVYDSHRGQVVSFLRPEWRP